MKRDPCQFKQYYKHDAGSMGFERHNTPGHCLKLLNENMRTDMLRLVHERVYYLKDHNNENSPLEHLVNAVSYVLKDQEESNLWELRLHNPFNQDPSLHRNFEPEADFKHDIKLLRYHEKQLKKTIKELDDF